MRRWACLLALVLIVSDGVGAPAGATSMRAPGWLPLIYEAQKDGRIEKTFTCATAREASRHLNPAMLPYGSPMLRIVRAYEARACGTAEHSEVVPPSWV